MAGRRGRVYHWIWIPLVVPALLFLGKEVYTGWVQPRMPWAKPADAAPPAADVKPAHTPSPQTPAAAKPAPPDRPPVVLDD